MDRANQICGGRSHAAIRWSVIAIICMVSTLASHPASGIESKVDRPPNIVVIYIDDLGYADIGPFGAEGYKTPNLDQLAREGRRFTDFEVSSAVCSASRAALMTGCYHIRVGISGALGPNAKIGISADEMTLGELCKSAGYHTACFGKWHLGSRREFLPLQHGFDRYYGLPYSNDMWPFHPGGGGSYPPLPLIEGNEVVDAEVSPEDQTQLTTSYTERAVEFIEDCGDEPFLLYVPHSMVHVPLFVSEKFRDKSGHGLFGDVMMEVDWSVGQIVDALKRSGVDRNTLLIFASDNGPWLSYGDHAGSARPLREGKGTSWEGGTRVPTIFWWPGRIPANTKCDELASTIDVFPTVASLIGAKLPGHKIDGFDISSLMFDDEDKLVSPHESFYYYYAGGELQAVRDRRWKLVLPHNYRTLDGKPGGTGGKPAAYSQAKAELGLYDLKSDVGEMTNVIDQHPDIRNRMEGFVEQARAAFGDKLTDRKGSERRTPGTTTEEK